MIRRCLMDAPWHLGHDIGLQRYPFRPPTLTGSPLEEGVNDCRPSLSADVRSEFSRDEIHIDRRKGAGKIEEEEEEEEKGKEEEKRGKDEK